MALGKPGIGTLHELSPRTVQGAVDAIRRRIEAIETMLTVVDTIARTAGQANSSSGNSLSNLQAQITALNSNLDDLATLVSTTPDLIDDAVRDEILEASIDTDIPQDTRLVIVSAVGNDVILTLPSGDIDNGARTQEITIYRRDNGSGAPGAVIVRSFTGELIDGSYELSMDDLDRRTFMAVGDLGWIET